MAERRAIEAEPKGKIDSIVGVRLIKIPCYLYRLEERIAGD